MPLASDPKGWFLNDLAAIEERIARSVTSESLLGEGLDPHEKRYRRLVENSLGLICTHDLDGVVLSVNPAAADSLGYEPQDGIGRNLRDFLAPSTRHLFDGYLHRMRERFRDSGVMRVMRRDGTERLWLYRNVLCVEPGAPAYVLGHAIDVTERATAEAALRRNQTQTLEATGRLAGHVAHSFNNLLTLILGSAELLESEIPRDSPAREHVDNILSAVFRGSTVTRQLLAVGGQQAIDRAVLDLNAVITGLQSLLTRVAGPRSVLTLALDPTLPSIDADRTQIEQILLHLAANAQEAMEPHGGMLSIETSPTRVLVGRGQDLSGAAGVRLKVRDSGRGMDAGTRSRLFEPFFTTKSRPEAGLGLSTVHGIVRQHGGSIAVDSEPGRGTTFTIVLPGAAAPGDSDTAAHGVRPPNGPDAQTILVVDDQDDVRGLMALKLRRMGYHVVEARGGAEAIRLMDSRGGPVDLLVTDVMMPGVGGRELHDVLTRRHPGLKTLFVSGYVGEGFQGEAGTDFLSKPFLLDTLARKVVEILGRK